MLGSLCMKKAQSVLDMSRFTRIEMGMMLLKRSTKRNRSTSQESWWPLRAVITAASRVVSAKSSFESLFNSPSSAPVFVVGRFAFITDRVSEPV